MTIKIEPGMYITIETLEKLGPIRYQLVNVLRGRGYKVSDAFGRFSGYSSEYAAILICADGDLVWTCTIDRRSQELTYEQVKSLIECYSEEQVKMLTNCSPETNTTLTIEELAQRIQRLTDQRDRLNTELDHYKQLLIKKLA